MVKKIKVRNTKLSVVILAAGGSTRLGIPKQLVKFKGASLLSRTTITALNLKALEVIVIIGAYEYKIRKHMRFITNARLVSNKKWGTGMATSIKVAIRSCSVHSEGILFLTTDQPLVKAADLRKIIALWKRNPNHQVASMYNDVLGVPAIIPKRNWGDLKKLSADHGARKILMNDPKTIGIKLSNASIDVDTKEDLLMLKRLC